VIKVLYAWRDDPDLGAEACEAHYRANHVRLARAAFDGTPGFVALLYNRVRSAKVNDHNAREGRPVTSDIDAFVELYFTDQASMDAAFAKPELTAMFEDHPNFMETDVEANVRIYEVDELVVWGELHRTVS
jgi:uncharacterized protein (TIGR02118 family)